MSGSVWPLLPPPLRSESDGRLLFWRPAGAVFGFDLHVRRKKVFRKRGIARFENATFANVSLVFREEVFPPFTQRDDRLAVGDIVPTAGRSADDDRRKFQQRGISMH